MVELHQGKYASKGAILSSFKKKYLQERVRLGSSHFNNLILGLDILAVQLEAWVGGVGAATITIIDIVYIIIIAAGGVVGSHSGGVW